jgi:pyrroloquinoline quinone (PQQ) biosynthesis protein C
MSFFEHLQQATAGERQQLMSTQIVADALAGQVTHSQYLRFLERAYHHVRHTPALLMACGARLSVDRAWLRKAVAHYIEEEIGHDDWILHDIAAAGGDADAVRASVPDLDTDTMVAYAYDTVMRRNPVGLFGMVYVLEGTSVAIAVNVADVLEGALALPANAFTYLRSHGELDAGHLREFARIVDRFDDADDRTSVELSAKRFFRLYGNVLRGIPAETNQ